MRVAICQPTYLPWLGYFDLIDQVDTFVLLDSVQFEKRSWQQRNRIKGPNGLILLTVPVQVKGRLDQPIVETTISEPQMRQKHLRTIETNYRKAPYFSAYWQEFSEVLQAGWRTGQLCELNVRIIDWCMRRLGVAKPILRSSRIPVEGKRVDLLLSVCEFLSADHYLSPIGSAGYLAREEDNFLRKDIEIEFHHYLHPQYEQLYLPFVPYASVIDLMFNMGDRALEVIRSGRKNSLSASDVQQRFVEQSATPI